MTCTNIENHPFYEIDGGPLTSGRSWTPSNLIGWHV